MRRASDRPSKQQQDGLLSGIKKKEAGLQLQSQPTSKLPTKQQQQNQQQQQAPPQQQQVNNKKKQSPTKPVVVSKSYQKSHHNVYHSHGNKPSNQHKTKKVPKKKHDDEESDDAAAANDDDNLGHEMTALTKNSNANELYGLRKESEKVCKLSIDEAIGTCVHLAPCWSHFL